MSGPAGNTYDKEATTNPAEQRLVSGFAAGLVELLPPRAGRVLEVGCGEGTQLRRLREALPGATVIGLDVPDETLVPHWQESDAVTTAGSAYALPFPDDTFDVVCALEVLEHLRDSEAALVELARVARSIVIVSVPWEPVWRVGNLLRGRYIGALGNTPGHVRHFTRRGFLRCVSRHLDVEAVRRPLPWTFVRGRPR